MPINSPILNNLITVKWIIVKIFFVLKSFLLSFIFVSNFLSNLLIYTPYHITPDTVHDDTDTTMTTTSDAAESASVPGIICKTIAVKKDDSKITVL